MKLVGAKEFLKTVKAGTLCISFWCSSQNQCDNLIQDYNNNIDITQKYKNLIDLEWFLYGDNASSLTFLDDDNEDIKIGNKIYNCLFHYDKNIVGDADPKETLYLVLEDFNDWPLELPVWGADYSLARDELIKIQKWFLKKCGPFTDENSTEKWAWALNKLETDDYYKNDHIVNYK